MKNNINIMVNKNDNSDYIFLKFEVTTNSVENSSDSDNKEEFDSFNKIKNLLSEKSSVVQNQILIS
ncbi:hypothetical protein CNO13_05070 (plasmid) [Borrelia miyamotoi]|uniref:Uncharacterized protein n=3 Tax=Borrelia miyamotoi TaxID=47466 RepID=A0AAQ3CMA2_9SPIR|nr:hypothetical protein [Borrelia miyamotoi]AHH05742.1 hypothetical protein BOM_1199 [Borrelia miyamotoi FR64b]ATQ16537.1 hypothetical protein CNO13_05070 [Borrelia miyamotoi]ATQ17683.1 hypothetical protein CNO12_05065 [Borrelia miyamotoi]ATQ18865.1 hypothetical protein CNO11_04630 [Borrelia miyamotoi]ATQ21379.1 hypothetical protein CNO09_04635 [Borrelia miyamotoi]